MKKYTKPVLFFVALSLLADVPTSAQQGGVGSSPYVAHLLTGGLNVGSLPPGQSFWYSYSQNDLGSAAIRSIILDMVFKPGDSRTARQVTFDIYTFDQVKTFLEGSKSAGRKEGSGQLVDADYDPDTGQRLWAGPVDGAEVYYIHVQNKSDLTVDYRLTVVPQLTGLPPTAGQAPGDSTAARTAVSREKPAALSALDDSPASSQWLMAAQAIAGLPADQAAAWLKNAADLGWLTLPGAAAATPKSTRPEAVGQTGQADNAATVAVPIQPEDNSIYPNNPLSLQNVNIGRLAPHAQHWYTFLRNDFDDVLFEEMALTMFQTPGEGNIANRVYFELFTGDQYHIWERGTPEDMTNTGFGQIVSRDGDPLTGERIWRGFIVDGDRYYIKVQNDSDVWVDYQLMIGDIINTELGGRPNIAAPTTSMLPAERIAEVVLPPVTSAPPTGNSIADPLTASVGNNRGVLAAGEDIWYAFSFENWEQKTPELRHYTIYLHHTPGLGYVANEVNVELYDYPQLDLWLRGTPDDMKPMGVGAREEYDPKTDTQEFTWDGSLVSHTTYFLRVRNNSIVDISYDLDIQRR